MSESQSAGAPIETITLARGVYRAEILTLGATLRSLVLPDGANVVLGYADLAAYREAPRFYGSVIGRYANRIGNARFTLDGTEYRLPANDGAHSLHSGPGGFDQQVWAVVAQDNASAILRLESPDGWNGFPGNLVTEVCYVLEDDGLVIGFTATSDRATIVSLTHHAYFNLAGEASGGSVLGHWLQIPASRFTPTQDRIPTGELRDVAGSAFDFRTPKPVGRDIARDDAQLAAAGGYDHNFVLDAPAGTLRRIATVFDPASGRVLDVQSTEPGVQLYTGNFLEGASAGTSGGAYSPHSGLCLEPQKFPDSPNQPAFPSARLDAGDTYRHDIVFRFRSARDVTEAFEPPRD